MPEGNWIGRRSWIVRVALLLVATTLGLSLSSPTWAKPKPQRHSQHHRRHRPRHRRRRFHAHTAGTASAFDFEDGTADGWGVQWGTSIKLTNTTTVAYSGTHSLGITVLANGYPGIDVCCSSALTGVGSGTPITYHLYSPVGGVVQVQPYSEDGNWNEHYAGHWTLGAGWSTISWTVPAETGFKALGLEVDESHGWTGMIALDGVSVGATSPPPTTTPTTTTTTPTTTTTTPTTTTTLPPPPTTPSPIPAGPVFYVSRSGNNTDGTSWATAWTNTSAINWSAVPSGAIIVLDGGSSRCSVSPYDFAGTSPNPGLTCGQRYAPFAVGQDHVTIVRSTDVGHDGTVVIDGGRDTPLPYCGQASYSATTGAAYGINLGSHSGVTIDGLGRSGIVVRGAQTGVRMGPGGNDTLRNLELFDNGYPTSHSYGYNSDGNDILMGGQNNVYDRLLVHDGGQDEFHSDSTGYSEAGSSVTNTWMGAMREHPVYTGEPFNDLQASGHNPGCTHADGIQIFAPGTTMAGLTIDHDVFGPGVNQGLYPSDSGTGTTFDDVSVTNTLFLDVARHNIISDNAVNGWRLDHDTIFATQGGFEIPSNGANTITNTVKMGGYVYTPGGTWATGGDDWYSGDPLPPSSANLNPSFASIPAGTLPSLASLRAADLTPSCSSCSGSPIHSWTGLLSLIDSLDS